MFQYIINTNSPTLVLDRNVSKTTSQAMHTSLKEVFKYREGWRSTTETETQHITRGSYLTFVHDLQAMASNR